MPPSAIVAGGSGGIGFLIAKMLVSRGLDVAIIARGPASGVRAADLLTKRGSGRAVFYPADLLSHIETTAAVASAIDDMGSPDVLVCSGGLLPARGSLFVETPIQRMWEYFGSHCLSRLNPMRAVLPAMVERRKGRIVVLTTDAGRIVTPGESLIGAAAAGTILAVRAVAKEVVTSGVRINAISMTLTRGTPGYRAQRTDSHNVMARSLRNLEREAPQGLPTAVEVARAAIFLVSDEASGITGTVLAVNRGVSFPS